MLSWCQHGKQFRKSLGQVSQQDAKLAQHAKEVELITGQTFLSSDLIFTQFANEYLDWYSSEFPSSYYRTEQIIRQHLMPAFEFYPLDRIRVREADRYKSTRLKDGPKISTVNKELRTLKAMLNKSVQWEYIKSNPLANLKYAKELDSKPERFYSKEELEIIYQYAPYNWHWWKF